MFARTAVAGSHNALLRRVIVDAALLVGVSVQRLSSMTVDSR